MLLGFGPSLTKWVSISVEETKWGGRDELEVDEMKRNGMGFWVQLEICYQVEREREILILKTLEARIFVCIR